MNQILIIQRIFSILQPLHFIDFVLGKCFSGQCASSFRYAGIAPQRSPGVWDWVQTIKPGIVSKKKIEKKLVPHELSDVSQRAVAKNSPTKQILTLFLLHHESVK